LPTAWPWHIGSDRVTVMVPLPPSVGSGVGPTAITGGSLTGTDGAVDGATDGATDGEADSVGGVGAGVSAAGVPAGVDVGAGSVTAGVAWGGVVTLAPGVRVERAISSSRPGGTTAPAVSATVARMRFNTPIATTSRAR
jgi:hypothetical protein